MTLQRHLTPGESLRWSGRPQQGLMLKASDAVMIPFSLLWGGFAIFWEVMAYRSGAPIFMLLFGGAFVLIGLQLIIGRFFTDAWIRGSTLYGLTNKRVIILKERPRTTVRSLELDQLADVTLSESSGGRGTITFGSAAPQGPSAGAYGRNRRAPAAPAFEGIEGVQQVYAELAKARERLRD